MNGRVFFSFSKYSVTIISNFTLGIPVTGPTECIRWSRDHSPVHTTDFDQEM